MSLLKFMVGFFFFKKILINRSLQRFKLRTKHCSAGLEGLYLSHTE